MPTTNDGERSNPTYPAEVSELWVPSEVASAHYTMFGGGGAGTLARKCHDKGGLLLSADTLNGHVCHLHAIK